jgi:hypothetical protein
MIAIEYLIWLTGMALAIIAVVAVGTLAAAGLLHRPRRHDLGRRAQDVHPLPVARSEVPTDRDHRRREHQAA